MLLGFDCLLTTETDEKGKGLNTITAVSQSFSLLFFSTFNSSTANVCVAYKSTAITVTLSHHVTEALDPMTLNPFS